MSAENPRWYKWYPTEETDLGAMPFEGDFTVDDRIVAQDTSGIARFFSYNSNTNEFGQYVN